MEYLFWTSASLVFYGTIGYPALIWFLGKVAPKPVRKQAIFPTVTCVIAARNEERTIGAKLKNLLAQDYPSDRLDIIVVSDGSTDDTTAIVEQYLSIPPHPSPPADAAPLQPSAFSLQPNSSPCVRLLTIPTHRGKAHALNMGVAAATGEIILFADARQRFADDAVRALVANFADSEVGAVSGELVFETTDQAEIGKGLGFYWQYEKFLRKAESLSGSTVACTGAIYAIRKSCFRQLPEGTLVDDLLTSMRILLSGYRVVFEPEARAFDSLSPSSRHEFRRKVRTLAGNIQVLGLDPVLLNPFRLRSLWRYFSHMLLPRVLMPYCLIILFLSNITLTGQVYQAVVVLQLIMYATGFIGLYLGSRGGLVLRAASTFLLLNVASTVAAVQYGLKPSHEMWRSQSWRSGSVIVKD